jgi:hypothetical protein
LLRPYDGVIRLPDHGSNVDRRTNNTYIICMWSFSAHAQIRMQERGFSAIDLLKVLQKEVHSIILPSPKDDTVDLYFSRIDKRYLLVVVDRITHIVITVRPMRRKEKDAFIKEIVNG